MSEAVSEPAARVLYAVDIEDQTVLLDVARDRYWLARRRRDSPASGEVRTIRRECVTGPAATQEVWPSATPRLLVAGRALGALRQSTRLLETSFSALFNHVERAPRAEHRRQPALEDLLASYAFARPFFGRARICRIDAPALCLLARRYGHPARLVFGVRLEPFAAHCWVQIGPSVINEPREYVGQFTPIVEI